MAASNYNAADEHISTEDFDAIADLLFEDESGIPAEDPEDTLKERPAEAAARGGGNGGVVDAATAGGGGGHENATASPGGCGTRGGAAKGAMGQHVPALHQSELMPLPQQPSPQPPPPGNEQAAGGSEQRLFSVPQLPQNESGIAGAGGGGSRRRSDGVRPGGGSGGIWGSDPFDLLLLQNESGIAGASGGGSSRRSDGVRPGGGSGSGGASDNFGLLDPNPIILPAAAAGASVVAAQFVVGDQVAAKVPAEAVGDSATYDGEGSAWILAEVTALSANESRVTVKDIDVKEGVPDTLYELDAATEAIALTHSTDGLFEFEGADVLAIFPGTTIFYKGKLHNARGSGGKVTVEWEDDGGVFKFYEVPAAHVLPLVDGVPAPRQGQLPQVDAEPNID